MPKIIEKISVTEAMAMYQEEKEFMMSNLPDDPDIILRQIEECYAAYNAEKAREDERFAQRVLSEDEAWEAYYWAVWENEAYQEADWMESEDHKAEMEALRAYFEEMDSDEEGVKPLKNMKAAERRKKDARHKKRVRNNAINAMRNNAKRGEDDQMASSSRGGIIVKDPKSLTARTEEVWKRAEKMKLVDDSTVAN